MNAFKLLIGGKLVDGDLSMDVVNPATGASFARSPRASSAQLNQAVAAARAAFPAWSRTPITDRQHLLNACADAIDAHTEELAKLLTQEQGKPLKDAAIEVMVTTYFMRYFANLELPAQLRDGGPHASATLQRRPLGVVGAIIPWNFPLAIFAFKAPAALLAGNTLVVKPAPTTPLATLRLGEILKDVLPAGVLNIITDANDLGAELTAHPDVRKISFTGSTTTGRKVMANAANTLKRLTLELGGNDAAIVLDDVDPKRVAPAIFEAAFQNSGQVCLALKRLYVHEKIYDSMCAELAKLANAAVLGDGLQEGVTHGPLQNKQQYEKVKQILADAKLHGKIIAGGEVLDRPGYFVMPTIVRDIAEGARLVDEEQFGPLLPIIRFSDPEDALARANACDAGLGGSVWSSDLKRAQELADRMEAGTVWINAHTGMSPGVPFGGAKQSGFGAEFGEEGLAEFTQLHAIYQAK